MYRFKRQNTVAGPFTNRPLVLTPKTVPQFVIPPTHSEKKTIVREAVIANRKSIGTVNEAKQTGIHSDTETHLQFNWTSFDLSLYKSLKRFTDRNNRSSDSNNIGTSDEEARFSKQINEEVRSNAPAGLPNIRISRHQSKKFRKSYHRKSKLQLGDSDPAFNNFKADKYDSDGYSSASSGTLSHRIKTAGALYIDSHIRDGLKRKRNCNRKRRRQSADLPCSCGRQDDTSDSEANAKADSEDGANDIQKDFINMSLGNSFNSFLNIPIMYRRRLSSESAASLSPRGSLTPASCNLSPRNSLSPCSSNCSSRKSSFTGMGDIKVALMFSKSRSLVSLRIVKARGLGSNGKPRPINSIVKACLLPGKHQKQQTSIVYDNRDPVFKETFTFRAVKPAKVEDLLMRCRIRVRVYNVCQKKRKNEFLGDAKLCLDSLVDSVESRYWIDLLPKSDIDSLGRLVTSLCLEKNSGTLTVTVTSASGLHRNVLSVAPDPYIKVLVFQEGSVVLQKKTKIKHKTTNPIFKEVFTFQVGTTEEHLESTSIEFTVYDRSKILSDDMIGQVKVGCRATEQSEILQWQELLNNNGLAVPATHDIMEADDIYQDVY